MSGITMYEKAKFLLGKMIDVNTPIIYINDHDYARIDHLISEVIINKKNIIEWNPATERTNFITKEQIFPESLETFLNIFYTTEYAGRILENILVLRDVHDLISSPSIKSLLEMIAQRKLYDRKFDTYIIIVSPILYIPPELDKYISILDIELPCEKDIIELIDLHIEINQYDKNKLNENDKSELVKSFKGMTPFEIDRIIDMAMSSNGSLSSDDSELIIMYKKQIVKRSGILELVASSNEIGDIGGLDILKEYIKKKERIFKDLSKAIQFGVNIPKGVLLIGMPGCGKSLSAKAAAKLFKAPLLKMDMGSMMGKYLGESEANLRKAIKIAEAASPCVLWIDEIEKMFSNTDSNNDTTSRMFGYFLSWMQDKQSSVYVIATANNAEVLPPELKRKGRFDEIFCINLPNQKEREEIFKVHIKKKINNGCKCDKDGFQYKELSRMTEGFNGADIESLINDAVETCFLDKSELNTDILLSAINRTCSVTKTCKEQIYKMEECFAKNDYSNASENPYWSNKDILSKKRK